MKKYLVLLLAIVLTACSTTEPRAQSTPDVKTRKIKLLPPSFDFLDGLTWRIANNTDGGVTWTWPTNNGSAGYVLTNNGSGTLSWGAPGGGSGPYLLHNDTLNSTQSLLNLAGDGITIREDTGRIIFRGPWIVANAPLVATPSYDVVQDRTVWTLDDTATSSGGSFSLATDKSIVANVVGGTTIISTPNFIDDGISTDAGGVSGTHSTITGGYDNHVGSNYSSIVGGFSNYVYGSASSAIIAGGGNEAGRGYSVTVGGEGLRTDWDHETVVGMYNDTSLAQGLNALFTIGNGLDEAHRSNAMVVTPEGSWWSGSKTVFDGPSGVIMLDAITPGGDGDILTTNLGVPVWTTPTYGSGSVTSITATAPLTGGTITASGSIGIPAANGSTDGYLSSTNWNTFNSKESALTFTSPLSRSTNTISLSTVPIASGGTGQTSANAAFNALAPSQTSNSGKVLTTDGTNTSWATVNPGAGIAVASGGGNITISANGLVSQAKLLFYGDGTDGVVVMNGTNTYGTFSSLVGSTYTLTRNIYATTFQTSGTVIVKTNGFAIFATTSVDNGSGCNIQNDGGNAAAGTGGVASNASGMFTNAANGSNGVSAISAGTAGTGVTVAYGGASGAGGSDGHAHAGGAAGTTTGPTALQGSIHSFPMMYFGGAFNNTGLAWWRAGAGGASGGNNCSGCSISGAGGAGGGTLAIYAPTVTNSGSMHANGGNGGTCAQVGVDSGGGGGGGGGLIVIVCGTYSGNAATATGGTHGNGVGLGSNGGDGGAGTVLVIQMN